MILCDGLTESKIWHTVLTVLTARKMQNGEQPQAAELTITQKYRDQEALVELLTRIGVAGSARRKLVSDDFTNMEQLVLNYSTDIDSFSSYMRSVNKTFGGARGNSAIRFSPIVMKRLVAVLFHFIQAVGCMHCVPDLDNINVDSCPQLILAFEAHQKRKEADGDDDSIIELPELKGHSNWTTYRDKFVSNLSNMNGARNIPLAYVIDETERPRITRNTPLREVDFIDLHDQTNYASTTTHSGPQYKEDNGKVWMLLKKSLLGHQPYHHVDEFEQTQNGRGAWLALKAYYEGEDFVNKTIQENLTKLRTLHYRGETQRFGFEQFIEIQKECYKRLRDVGFNNGMGVDEATKCSNLKTMILSDAQLETALSIARTRGLFNGTFDNLVHFLKAEVDELVLRKKQLRAASGRGTRISSVTSQGGNTGGRGRGGRGRGRGGRGRGRGRGRGNRKPRTYLTRVVQGKEIHNGNYHSSDFANLTREQKDAVRDLRKQGEALASATQDTASIHSLVTQAVNDKLEAAVICGVANATGDNDAMTQLSGNASSSVGGGSEFGSSGSSGTKRKAQSGNVGDFLSNKKLQITFKPNK